jgi:hypothetical protein
MGKGLLEDGIILLGYYLEFILTNSSWGLDGGGWGGGLVISSNFSIFFLDNLFG